MAKVTIDASLGKSVINKNIYGHFSEHLGRCIYEGLYVGEGSSIKNVNGMRVDVVEALKNIMVPVLRWPGGCFADEYHWKDGVGPKDKRKKIINTNWGGVVEDNSFGTHEFLELCSQLGCEPYICANVGSGTVSEMADWIEYLNSPEGSPMGDWRAANGRKEPWNVKFIGVGNENWGCGGSMRPEYYADEYRRYQTFAKNHGGKRLFKIACGPNGADYEWTDKLMSSAGRMMDGLALHHYTLTGPWDNKGSATSFTEEQYYKTIKAGRVMQDLIQKHTAIMQRHDLDHKVSLVVDEWGTWHDVEPGTPGSFLYQQNTIRDAMLAALTLNIFNQESAYVSMANIAQIANVLQSMVLTDGEKMVLTPTYHVFDLYKEHQGATLLDAAYDEGDANGAPELSVSASMSDSSRIHATFANLSYSKVLQVECEIQHRNFREAQAKILTGNPADFNDFDHPNTVSIAKFDVEAKDGVLRFELPPASVAAISVL